MVRLRRAMARAVVLAIAAVAALTLVPDLRDLGDAHLVVVRGQGYWLAQRAGDVSAFGDAVHAGETATGSDAVVDIAPTPTGQGYWVATRGGVVRAFGDALHFGNVAPNKGDLVAVVPTPTGNGYWLVTHRGFVKAGGDALALPSLPAANGAFVDAFRSIDGKGLVAATNRGEVLRVGNGKLFGQGLSLRGDTVGIAHTPTYNGYRLVTALGDVGAFGDAVDHGGRFGIDGAPVVDIAALYDGVSGSGYWLALSDGSVHAFGAAAHFGDLAGSVGSQPLAAMASTPFVNHPPDAVDDSATTNEDTAVLVDVGANDSDPDGDPLTYSRTVNGTRGTATLVGGSVFRYVPKANLHGPDSFSYRATDPFGRSDTAVVRIQVLPVNDPPLARRDDVATDEDVHVDVSVLANDTDVDGDPIHVVSFTAPVRGSVARVPAGGDVLRYTPNANVNGTDKFKYTIADPSGLTSTVTVFLTIRPVNDPPVAGDDAAAVDEDSFVDVNLATGDSDVEGDPLSFAIGGGPAAANGSVVMVGPSTARYTPATDYNGGDSFAYVVDDGHGASDVGTVSVAVAPVNDPPAANDDAASTGEDTAIDVDVLANDTDVDGDGLSASLLAPPANGSVAAGAGGTLRYTPAADFNGLDSFTYTASDGNGGSATASVSVEVRPVNDPPLAVDDVAGVNEDSFVDVDLSVGDSDVDGDALSFALGSTAPGNGSVLLIAPSTARYTPAGDFVGVDAFDYVVSDGSGASDVGTVTVTVGAVNDPPVANDDAGFTPEDTPVDIDVVANDTDLDGDALVVASFGQGASGAVSTGDGGALRYTPSADFNGEDSFPYTVRDPSGATSSATVRVTVGGVNDPPVAADDVASTDEDSSVLVDVLANDTDPEGDALTVVSVGPATGGTTGIEAGGVRFAPPADGNGSFAFTYRVQDALGAFDDGAVTVNVAPVNDAPVAVADSYSATSGVALSVPAPGVLGNDSDIDTSASGRSAQLVSGVSSGALSLAADGGFTYTSSSAFTGAATFTYRVSDGALTSNTVTVTITVASGGGGGGGGGGSLGGAIVDPTHEITDRDTIDVTSLGTLSSTPRLGDVYSANGRRYYEPQLGVRGVETLVFSGGTIVVEIVPHD